jgi:hypothetical protein
MHAGVEQNAVIIHLHQPGAGANVRIGVQIGDFHRKSLTTDGPGWTQIKWVGCGAGRAELLLGPNLI